MLTLRYRIKDINTHCLQQFKAHWECLENNNHNLYECRGPEFSLNKCVFTNLVCLYMILLAIRSQPCKTLSLIVHAT